MQNNMFKGISLFNDIEDKVLQTRNRAVVLSNLAEANSQDRKVGMQAAGLILSYFNNLPDEDKPLVRDKFKEVMEQRGYVLAAS